MFTDRTAEYIAQVPDDTSIWRYINLNKFADLICSKTLFFSQLSHLDDPFEGSAKELEWLPVAPGNDLEAALKMLYQGPNGPRGYCTVNCWHINPHEANNMWELYLRDKHINLISGVAINTSVGRLRTSLQDPAQFGPVHWGAVSYEPLTQIPSPGTIIDSVAAMLFRKRPYFAHEREYRILIYARDLATVYRQKGIRVKVDLGQLLQQVVVAPESPSYVVSMIEDLLQYHNLECPVRRSFVDDIPPY